MRKWVVLTLGVLLAVAGLISLWHGIGLVEFERGTAAVIAGAVFLSGGIITIALYSVLCGLEQLKLAAPASAAAPATEMPKELEAPAVIEAPAPEPELKLPSAAPLPPLPVREEPAPLKLEIEPPKFELPTPAPVVETKPVEPKPEPAPVVPVVAVAATTAVAAGGFFGLRNLFARRAEPVKLAEAEHAEDDSAPKLPDFLIRRDVVLEQKNEDERSVEDVAVTEESVDEARAEDERGEGPSDQDKYAWLEKALSGEDEEKPEPEFDWLRNRNAPDPDKEPILEDVREEDQSEPEQEPEQQKQVSAAPEIEPVTPPPSIIGRYNSGGAEYTLYSDGSIDAETAEGHLHFASMADLRAHIETQQNRA